MPWTVSGTERSRRDVPRKASATDIICRSVNDSSLSNFPERMDNRAPLSVGSVAYSTPAITLAGAGTALAKYMGAEERLDNLPFVSIDFDVIGKLI